MCADLGCFPEEWLQRPLYERVFLYEAKRVRDDRQNSQMSQHDIPH